MSSQQESGSQECDHEHSMVELGMVDLQGKETDNECSWCGFGTVTALYVKDRVHSIAVCEQCETDLEMLFYNGVNKR